jgi:hypothetical protein
MAAFCQGFFVFHSGSAVQRPSPRMSPLAENQSSRVEALLRRSSTAR